MSGEEGGEAFEHVDDVFAEVEQDGEKGADMDSHVEEEGVLPHIFTVAEEMVGEDEMAAGTDGEEFGEALNDGENEDGKECHGFSIDMLYYQFLALRL